jgi:hypothetical protein
MRNLILANFKKIHLNPSYELKVMPILRKDLRVSVFKEKTKQNTSAQLGQSFPILQHRNTAQQSFSVSEQPRTNISWCMQQ